MKKTINNFLGLVFLLSFFQSSLSLAQNSAKKSGSETENASNASNELVEEIQTDLSSFTNVAVIQGLNKTTAKTSILEVPVGRQINFGQIEITAHKCWQAPLDQKPESKILIEVKENKNGQNSRIFYGWIFASSPSISGLEHPIYDLIALKCK